MKHGKRHRAEVAKSLPAWEREFISYKKLKKQVKLIRSSSRTENGDFPGNNEQRLRTGNMGFTLLLHRELDKVNSFYIEKEEDYIIRLKEMQIRFGKLRGNEEKLELQKDILEFHAEMVMLLHYSVLNFTGLIKIVKKHKKKTGGVGSVRLPYMPSELLQQPFFSTDLLYNLIKECESMVNRLFDANDDDP